MDMDVDRGGRGTGPPEFGVGDANANSPPSDFVIHVQKERSMAFKIRQISRLEGDTPSHAPPHAAPTHAFSALAMRPPGAATDGCHPFFLKKSDDLL